MIVYTPIRYVERVLGRGVRGGRLLFGPLNYKRDMPILLPGMFIALSVLMLEFPLIGAMFQEFTVIRLLGVLAIATVAAIVMLTTLVAVAWGRNAPAWPPRKVLFRARVNQWRRRPVYVSGRDQLSPASVTAGGKVRVR
ncbi:Uncharacterised protein [Mycobacteroides abscessus subsp. bolletii]|uniref:hypothetical protein n=1 Tax=Mycobacteroides abscessus TaxID=36809 RepID=UPI0009A57A53|nr:hypothetical protein [Mycobacteroides abscessus]SKZ03027.1 Uncharacterised protein [Mycobacteroides abscessus subsp. bolletii]